ncbi:MAG: fumarate reductase subunit C [Betaproteobacteria bacterium]|nr:fumarate reductase subunit C [Betaproteobacteria bacterium]
MSRKPYAREISSEWIFRHPRYLRYLVREFSCLFIGGYALLMVVGLKRLAEGPAAWEGFLQALQAPASIAFHLVALAFSLYHSVTWFNLTPKAIPLPFISAAHYAAWGATSIALLWMAGVF